MAERSMDTSGASMGTSVRMDRLSPEPSLMEELFNYVRGMSSKLDTVLCRLDDMERQNDAKEKQYLEILKDIKSFCRKQAKTTPPTDGQVFTSIGDADETAEISDSDSLSEVSTEHSHLPRNSRTSRSTQKLEMQHETAATRNFNNVFDPIKSSPDGSSTDKVVKMMPQSNQIEETEPALERNTTKVAVVATKGVERLTISGDQEANVKHEELVASIKATTRAELIWLANQVDNSMSNITKTLNGISSDVSNLSTKAENGLAAVGADIVKNCQEVVESLDNRVAERLSKTDIEVADGFNTLRVNLMTTQKQLEEAFSSTVKENKEKSSERIEAAVDAIKQHAYRAKREIFAVVEKEAQLIRDKRTGPWPPWPTFTSYCFDFYVEDCGYFIGTGKHVHSLPWHINQFKSCVVGKVQFLLDGKMEIWMVYGRDPRRVGFRPNFFTNQLEVAVTATIIACQDDHQDLTIAPEKTWSLNEEDMVDSEEKGIKLGEVPCNELLSLGYARHENGSILVRYVVKPL